MELKEIVALYAKKEGKSIEVDLKGLLKDTSFRSLAIAAVLEKIKSKPRACVLIPAYNSNNKNLGEFINELALTLQVETLGTGDVKNLRCLRGERVKEAVLIKQSFRAGQGLAEQIAFIQARGIKVSVLCLISHCQEMLEQFGKEHGVEITALLNTDEL